MTLAARKPLVSGDDPSSARRWRRLGTWVVGLALAGAATPTLARLSGYDAVTPLPMLVVFAPYTAGITVGVLTAGLLLRSRWICVAAAVVLSVQVALLAPLFLPKSATVAPASAPGRLRVMTANILHGQVDPDAFVASIRRNAPDLLAVEELTPQAAVAFDHAGLTQLLPYRIVHAEPGGDGTGLYSRLPLLGQGVFAEQVSPCWGQTTFFVPWATVAVAGQAVRVMAVHTCTPLPGQVQAWVDELQALRRTVGAGPGPQVVMGDFNATDDHASFRDLLANGLTDVHDDLGRGIVRTWPVRVENSDVPLIPVNVPVFHLDHVLISPQVKVVMVREETIPGSDHRAVVAELRIPAA